MYLTAFALTFGGMLLCNRFIPPVEQRALSTKVPGGRIYHTQRGWALFAFLLCWIPLFLLSALREGIGTDYYYTYTPRFLEIVRGERTYYEIGFYWFNRLVAAFTHNPQWLFVVTSLLFMGCVALSYYDVEEDLPFCVIYLLVSGEYFISLNNLRQAMASALMLFGYRFVRRRQWVRFGLLAILCTTIHQSMLVFVGVLVLFILLEYMPLHRLFILLSAGAGAGFILVNSSPAFLRLILPDRMIYYIEEAMYLNPTIGLMRAGINVGILVFLLFTRYRSDDRQLDPFIIMQLLSVVVCLFDATLPAAYRILRLFTFWQLLSVPMAVSRYTRQNGDRWWVKGLIVVVMGFLCVYSLVYLGTEEVIPYHSIFH